MEENHWEATATRNHRLGTSYAPTLRNDRIAREEPFMQFAFQDARAELVQKQKALSIGDVDEQPSWKTGTELPR